MRGLLLFSAFLAHADHAATTPTPTPAVEALHARMQAIVDEYSNVTGIPMQASYVTGDIDLAVAADPWGATFGRAPIGVDSPFLYGSGVKTFVGARTMQLVEAGVLSLDDKAAKWMDPVLDAMNGTSLSKLLGPNASAVTVGHLVRMSSGIADYDVPDVDFPVLDAANVTSPLDILYMFPQRSQFACAPGTCVSYSSTNFLLAGFVLLGAAGLPAAQLRALGDEAWTALPQLAVLEYAAGGAAARRARYPNTRFLAHGALNASGLAIPGFNSNYRDPRTGQVQPRAKVWEQDASILGWTCGNLLTTAREEARFLWDLLGDPASPVVSAPSRAAMSAVRPLTEGWADRAPYWLQYGTGLMVQTVYDGDYGPGPFEMNGTGAHLGHGGMTYGFFSNSGFFPLVNATMSCGMSQPDIPVGINAQTDDVLCAVLQAAAALLHGNNVSLRCHAPTQMYSCVPGGANTSSSLGQCVPDVAGVYSPLSQDSTHSRYEHGCALPGTATTCRLPPAPTPPTPAPPARFKCVKALKLCLKIPSGDFNSTDSCKSACH